MQARWMIPYLLIPPALAVLVFTESYLGVEGIAGMFTIHQRSILALWNVSFLISLIAGVGSCLFFSGLWGNSEFIDSLSRFSKSISGYWSPVFAFISVSSAVYSLASLLIVLILPGEEYLLWLRISLIFYVPVLWSICVGALMGLLTTGGAGAFFFVVLFLFSFFSGMAPIYAFSLRTMVIIPPIGLIMKETFNDAALGYLFSIILGIHCLILLGIGRILFVIGLRRN